MDGESIDPKASALNAKLGDDVDLDDTKSVMSDLSTDEFTTDLNIDFRDAMNRTEDIKPFLSLHTVADFPGGVSVDGVGDISAPLTEIQAQQIIAYTEENNPVYQDDDTEGDDTEDADTGDRVTTFLSIDSSQFTLDDSVWLDIIQDCLDQAARDRNITTPLRADPWAMILVRHGNTYGKQELVQVYEPDCPGCIAIFLPSIHEGGEIAVKSGETEEVVFAPYQAAQSFSTDDFHIESRPIQSGYAWALICGVRYETLWRPLRHTLRRWIEKDSESRSQDIIFCPLEHNYTNGTISEYYLTGEDDYRVQVLQCISFKIPFEVFLAKISKKDNYDLARETGQSTKRQVYIFGLDAHRITNPRFLVDEKALVPHTDLDYTAVVIIPRDTVLPFFYGTGSLDVVESLLVNYARACLQKPYHALHTVVFKQIWDFMTARTAENTDGHWARLTIPDYHLLDVLEALCATKSYSWFSRFGVHYARDLPKLTFSRFRARLDTAYLRDKKLHKEIEAVLSAVIIAYSRPAQQIKAVKTIIDVRQGRSQGGRPRPRLVEIPSHTLPFVRQVLTACIEACGTKQLTAQDGQALVGFSLYFDDPFAILSLIKDKIGLERQPAAILGFIHKVDYYGKSGYLPQEEALQLTQDVAKSLITSTDFIQWRGIADGYYFKKDEDLDTSFVHYNYNEDIYIDERFHPRTFKPRISLQEMDEKRRLEAEHEYYLEDDYDDHEYPYADSYRNCIYIDKDPLKCFKDRLDENSHEHLYGRSQPSTSSPPGIEENGVHYRSFYCFFEQLFGRIEQFDEVLELLISKVVKTAPHIPHTEFDTLWIPLAKEVLVTRNLLVDASRESLVSGLLSAILKAYVNTWVGQYPKRPSLVREGVHCSCPDCKGLNVFLADPSLRAGRFKADRTRVQHLLDEMTRANVDFKSDMMEDADSVALTVIKTLRLFAHELRQWGNRRYYASKEVAKFGQRRIEFVFGTEWMSFMSMGHLGGVGFDNLEIRILLRIYNGLDPFSIAVRSLNNFFRGLPQPPKVAGQASHPARKRKWSEADSSSDY
ncbi:hypothetical protein A0O28_0099640 [Trichoderma guizhouense]|uniref:Uncharacterized protein n=1 Tax=Trichoderma guizhouense TaxID=1491466 RepID=A0A1T3CRJ8_9HYPO|nr:hypothetical protein A0O28_0099640 [Trichoderma guizhouense]